MATLLKYNNGLLSPVQVADSQEKLVSVTTKKILANFKNNSTPLMSQLFNLLIILTVIFNTCITIVVAAKIS